MVLGPTLPRQLGAFYKVIVGGCFLSHIMCACACACACVCVNLYSHGEVLSSRPHGDGSLFHFQVHSQRIKFEEGLVWSICTFSGDIERRAEELP